MKFVTGIADSVTEFNSIYNSINSKTTEVKESEGTIEEIKNYEPIFTKKTIFNPFDDIDNLIQSIFNNPDMLEDFDFKTGTTKKLQEIPMEFNMDDDDEEEDDDDNNDLDDDTVCDCDDGCDDVDDDACGDNDGETEHGDVDDAGYDDYDAVGYYQYDVHDAYDNDDGEYEYVCDGVRNYDFACDDVAVDDSDDDCDDGVVDNDSLRRCV